MKQARLKAALVVIAANLAIPESELIRALVERGYTLGEANRLVAFVPMAFARPILERLGVIGFSNTVSVPTDGATTVTAHLDRQPEYVTALAVARQQMLSLVIDADAFKAIAFSSADIAAISRALDAGVDVKGSSMASALIGTSYAEHVLP